MRTGAAAAGIRVGWPRRHFRRAGYARRKTEAMKSAGRWQPMLGFPASRSVVAALAIRDGERMVDVAGWHHRAAPWHHAASVAPVGAGPGRVMPSGQG